MRKVSDINEYEMLCSIAAGSQDAFALLFERFKNKVYSFAHHYTHSDSTSEEITQEVFMKIWIKRDSMPAIENIESWIATVTRNLCFNQLKRKAMELKVKNAFAGHECATADTVEEYISYKSQLNNLNNALQQLSPQQRVIFNLNRDRGLKNEEIAVHLNLTTSTVKNHMVVALKKIRHFMEARAISSFILTLLFLKNIFF